ncbi:TetR/AcrR family transcriptional regulator [Kineococcus rubinsiae]|uniref:TetR/AcrR family transcriptional regulator n=1 Tax=Kineococcus rubinsiae TaxID=2609562 RepID=UPI001431E9FF|nr:TetR/AcrR family transcriptional regulator [Kineococcus rubinsiae]
MTETEQAPRVTRRRVQTRQRMLEAALQVVAERSLASASIEAVCERAGYTRGAFYSNFASMDDLLVALFEDRAETVLLALRTGLRADPASTGEGSGQRGEQEVGAVVSRLLRTLPADRLWYLVLTDVSAQALRDPRAALVLADYRASTRRQVAEALATALEHLGRRAATSVEALTAAVVAQFEGSVAQVHLDGHPPAEDERVGALTALVLGMTVPADPDGARA